jgi:hypothetical protein
MQGAGNKKQRAEVREQREEKSSSKRSTLNLQRPTSMKKGTRPGTMDALIGYQSEVISVWASL